MAVFVVGLLFILALAGYSDANYCVCNPSLSDSVLQKNIDYACGNGADCAAILQTGPCYNPNTVRDHCNYAVNSYYQRKGNAAGSCDFSGTCSVTSTPPNVPSGCVFPSSPSNTGSTTPTSPTTGGTPTTPVTPTPPGTPTTPMTPTPPGTPTTPNTGGSTAAPGTFPGGSTTPGTVPGTPTTPGFNLGPTGSGFSNTDGSSADPKLLPQSKIFTLMSMISAILISGLICPMI